MKRIIILILISFITLHTKSIIFTNKDKELLKNDPTKKAVYLRFKKYLELKKKIQNFSVEKKLSYVNIFYNKTLPLDDQNRYRLDDYWATPKEFIIQGRGDCEDYAIAKYFALLEVGIPKDKLFLTMVNVKGSKNYHMVLSYIKNKKSIPLILDNLSFRVLALDKRTDLSAKFIFNEKESFILKNNRIYKKAQINWGKENKWENLLKRVYEKNE